MKNKSFFEEADKKQIGGDHYKLKIQPYHFIMENRLNFFQGNVIKYVVRYLKKDQIKDLNKISLNQTCHKYLTTICTFAFLYNHNLKKKR